MKTLADETLEQVALFLKCMSEVSRLKILRLLHDGEKSASDIIAETGAGQSNISKHLSILMANHLVTSRKEGTSIYYKIADPNVTSICDKVCRSIAERIRQAKSMLKNIERSV